MSYGQEFAEAVERSKKLGFDVPEFVAEPERRRFDALTLRHFPHVLYEALGELELEDLVAQCLSIHHRMIPAIQDWLGCPALYTLGWIDFGAGESMFQFGETFINETLRTGYWGGGVQMHAWLTLPTMEIIDVSLSTSIGFFQKRREMLGGATTMHADDLRGMAYKPMLVGDGFLRRTGMSIDWPPKLSS